MNPNKAIPMVIKLSDCRVDKYRIKDLERLKPFNGIIARENSGLYLQLRLVRNRLLLELRSEIQNSSVAGAKRATKRRSFWKSETCPDMTPALLGVIKNDAEAFRRAVKTVTIQGLLSDYTEPWLATFTNEQTKKNYRKALNRPYIADWLKGRSIYLSVDDLKAVDKLILAEDILNRTKNEYRRTLCNFLGYVARETANETLVDTIVRFKRLLEPLKNESSHFKSIEAKTEEELSRQLQEAVKTGLSNAARLNPALAITFLKHFLIPVRPAENMRICQSDLTPENLNIPYTKTIKDGIGFDVPITQEVFKVLNRDFTQSEDPMLFTKLGLKGVITAHGVRAVFCGYMMPRAKFEIVEACTSHKLKGSVQNAYHRNAKNYFYEERQEVMPLWYTYIFQTFRNALEEMKTDPVLSPLTKCLSELEEVLPPAGE